MIIGNHSFVILLVDRFFKTFTSKKICDTTKDTKVIVALSTGSREKVDDTINKAIEAGNKEDRDPREHGWMYGRSFEDIDEHHWEIIYIVERTVTK